MKKIYFPLFVVFAPIALCLSIEGKKNNKKNVSINNIMHIDKANQLNKHLQPNAKNVVIVHAHWCGPCKKLLASGSIEQAAQQNPTVNFLLLEESKLAQQNFPFDPVRAYPTIIFAQGAKEASRTAGPKTVSELQNSIDNISSNDNTIASEPIHKKKAVQQPKTQPASAHKTAQQTTSMPQPTSSTSDKKATSSGQVIEITSENQFNDLVKRPQHKVVDFSTTWCGPCKQLKPVFVQAAQQYPDALFIMVDGDKFCNIVSRFGATGYPTVVFINKQGNVIEKRSGFRGKEYFEKQVKNLLEK